MKWVLWRMRPDGSVHTAVSSELLWHLRDVLSNGDPVFIFPHTDCLQPGRQLNGKKLIDQLDKWCNGAGDGCDRPGLIV